eukprot:m.116296 g.116296  ORF g.116296 m.116296 type:complete len:330 (+) comp17175_c0_seq2:237-1226(+)
MPRKSCDKATKKSGGQTADDTDSSDCVDLKNLSFRERRELERKQKKAKQRDRQKCFACNERGHTRNSCPNSFTKPITSKDPTPAKKSSAEPCKDYSDIPDICDVHFYSTLRKRNLVQDIDPRIAPSQSTSVDIKKRFIRCGIDISPASKYLGTSEPASLEHQVAQLRSVFEGVLHSELPLCTLLLYIRPERRYEDGCITAETSLLECFGKVFLSDEDRWTERIQQKVQVYFLSYAGRPATVLKILKLLPTSTFLGVSAISSFKNSEELRDLVFDFPLEQILIEHDDAILPRSNVTDRRQPETEVCRCLSSIESLQGNHGGQFAHEQEML